MTEQIQLHTLTADLAERLTLRADRVPQTITVAINHYRQLVTAIDELESAGITNASIHMRDSKYMYLIHPTQPDGSRQREYIGADPDKQAAARARLERFARHQELTRQANKLLSDLEHAQYFLDQILYTLREA
jgi:hypothetical protein